MRCQREGCENVLKGRQRKYCSRNCVKRACDARHRKTCPDCGAAMSVRSGWTNRQRTFNRCDECRKRVDARAREARLEDVAEMYREGMTLREIARELGYGENSVPPEVTEARRRGLIGYRNRGYGRAA